MHGHLRSQDFGFSEGLGQTWHLQGNDNSNLLICTMPSVASSAPLPESHRQVVDERTQAMVKLRTMLRKGMLIMIDRVVTKVKHDIIWGGSGRLGHSKHFPNYSDGSLVAS